VGRDQVREASRRLLASVTVGAGAENHLIGPVTQQDTCSAEKFGGMDEF
jgi:hypothetical protein